MWAGDAFSDWADGHSHVALLGLRIRSRNQYLHPSTNWLSLLDCHLSRWNCFWFKDLICENRSHHVCHGRHLHYFPRLVTILWLRQSPVFSKRVFNTWVFRDEWKLKLRTAGTPCISRNSVTLWAFSLVIRFRLWIPNAVMPLSVSEVFGTMGHCSFKKNIGIP